MQEATAPSPWLGWTRSIVPRQSQLRFLSDTPAVQRSPARFSACITSKIGEIAFDCTVSVIVDVWEPFLEVRSCAKYLIDLAVSLSASHWDQSVHVCCRYTIIAVMQHFLSLCPLVALLTISNWCMSDIYRISWDFCFLPHFQRKYPLDNATEVGMPGRFWNSQDPPAHDADCTKLH